MTTESAVNGRQSLFNSGTLSDVIIKFSGHTILAHKAFLASASTYFLKAFTGGFPVASSGEVDLGDDEEPEVVRAMIRHIYDLPYNRMVEDDTADNIAAYSTNEDLKFHINVFTAADKYDIPTLRPLVVKKFENLMSTNWESEQFAPAIKALCEPSAGHLADSSPQATAATFCADHITGILKVDSFVTMIEEEEPFTGRLLTRILRGGNVAHTLCVCVHCNSAGLVNGKMKYLNGCTFCGTHGGKMEDFKLMILLKPEPIRPSFHSSSAQVVTTVEAYDDYSD